MNLNMSDRDKIALQFALAVVGNASYTGKADGLPAAAYAMADAFLAERAKQAEAKP